MFSVHFLYRCILQLHHVSGSNSIIPFKQMDEKCLFSYTLHKMLALWSGPLCLNCSASTLTEGHEVDNRLALAHYSCRTDSS